MTLSTALYRALEGAFPVKCILTAIILTPGRTGHVFFHTILSKGINAKTVHVHTNTSKSLGPTQEELVLYRLASHFLTKRFQS